MNQDIVLKDAKVYFPVRQGYVKAVDNVNIRFPENKITGIIGESGCGKSVLGMYLLGLLPEYAKKSGEIWYEGRNLESLSLKERRKLRGKKLGLIPQNPGDSLNPARKIRGQIQEAIRLLDKNEQKERSSSGLLMEFGFKKQQLSHVENAYPFMLSGGMQQRAVAAMGVASRPRWILADEPSKGLDMTLRKQMYETLELVRQQEIQGMIIITHDLVLAGNLCNYIAVMYAGQIMEAGENVLKNPLHPYTRGILNSLPENGMHPMKGIAPAPGEYECGCRFAPRCAYASEQCFRREPEFQEKDGQKVRCYLYA